MKEGTHYSLGVDIGSTTLKVALLDENGKLVYTDYQRHKRQKKCSFNFNTKNLQSSSYNPDFLLNIKICSR